MIGSVAIAAFIAEAAFVVLTIWGWVSGELTARAAAVFVALAALVLFALPRLQAGYFVTSALAVLDIALVFTIFKGDVRIG